MLDLLTSLVKWPFGHDRKIRGIIHKITGLYPVRIDLYKLAFIHKSASLKMPDGQLLNNERLEFLGDAILDATVGEYLYRNFPDKPEGFLTQTRSKIVNGESLAHLAATMGIDKLIVSHASHFDKNKNILADAFEALIGAVYLDHGYKAVRRFILKQLVNKYIDMDTVLNTDTNFKSRLIEWSQHQRINLIFNTQAIDSESHIPHFSSEVIINDAPKAIGYGLSKKEAEQQAAHKALQLLQIK